jgi:hypothetical protein
VRKFQFLVVAGLFVGAASLSAATIIIDHFDDTQAVTIAIGGSSPTTIASGVSAPGAVGGSRYVSLTRTSGNGASAININSPSASIFNQSNDAAAESDSLTMWDAGTDNVISPTGLAVDLTGGGTNTQLHFKSSVDLNGVIVTFRFYTSNLSTYSQASQTLTGGGATFDYLLPFAGMTAVGGGATFTNIGAITMSITGPQRMDLQIDLLEANGDEDVPEPMTLGLVGSALAGLALLRRRIA